MPAGIEQIYKEKGDTWPKILRYNYQKYGADRRAMRYKHYGIWQPLTWKEYYLNVKFLALGLLSLGFEPGDKVIITGDNAPQWYYAELAAQANHGASVGIYSDLKRMWIPAKPMISVPSFTPQEPPGLNPRERSIVTGR